MKLFTVLRLTFIAATLVLTSNLQAHETQTNSTPAENPNPKNLTNDQTDPTDALAIPLDSSETEQQEEIKDLEQESKQAPQGEQPKTEQPKTEQPK